MFSIYMKKFHNSIIFMISCCDKDVREIYIGSTTHYNKWQYNFVKDYYKGSQNRTIYQIIRDNGDLINWDFQILEHVSCNNKMELEEREFYYWNMMIEPIQPPQTYKQILHEVDKIQALRIQNEIYVNNFQKLINQVEIYGMIQFPQPEKN